MLTIFLLGRIILGGYFIYSSIGHLTTPDALAGYAGSKGVPMPKTSVIVTGLMLLFGGLAILLGVLVQPGIIVLIIFLIGTLVQMHDFWKATDSAHRMAERVQFAKNLALIGALLMLYAIPFPWAYSLMF